MLAIVSYLFGIASLAILNDLGFTLSLSFRGSPILPYLRLFLEILVFLIYIKIIQIELKTCLAISSGAAEEEDSRGSCL